MTQEWLPAKLRLLRAQKGLTLIEAAERIGIGRDTLSDLERGRRHPVMPTLVKIAQGYEVPIEELVEPVPPKASALPESSEDDEQRYAERVNQLEQHEAEMQKRLTNELLEYLTEDLAELDLSLLDLVRRGLPAGIVKDAAQRAQARASARVGIRGQWQETPLSARQREEREQREQAASMDAASPDVSAEAG
jgi:transcriptional regulator with XRE-family HTH domain